MEISRKKVILLTLIIMYVLLIHICRIEKMRKKTEKNQPKKKKTKKHSISDANNSLTNQEITALREMKDLCVQM